MILAGTLFVGWCVSLTFRPVTKSPAATSASTTSEKPESSDGLFLDLHARVNFTGTQFRITNLTDDLWTDVKMEINGGLFSGGFELRTANLRSGETITVGALQFAKSDGTRFNPFQLKPNKFVITAKVQGRDGIYVGGWQ